MKTTQNKSNRRKVRGSASTVKATSGQNHRIPFYKDVDRAVTLWLSERGLL